MSGKIMGKVWDLDLPHNQLLVLLSLADHADHQGNNVFPSLGLTAWKTGYSEQQVRRVLKELEAAKILVVVERTTGKRTVYNIDLSAGKLKPEYVYTPSKKSPLPKSKGYQNVTSDPLHSDGATPYIAPEEVEGINRQLEPSIEPSYTNTALGSAETLEPPLEVVSNPSKELSSNASDSKPTPSSAPPPPTEAQLIAGLIKSWLDASGTIQPTAYGNNTIRGQAGEMVKRCVTPEHIRMYIENLRRDSFWKDKEIKWAKVAGEIIPWLTSKNLLIKPDVPNYDDMPKPTNPRIVSAEAKKPA